MKSRKSRTPLKGLISVIIFALALSGALRLGQAGMAVAQNKSAGEGNQASDDPSMSSKNEIEELIAMLNERSIQLDKREEQIQLRADSLDEAEKILNVNLSRLEATEKRLAATITRVNTAAQDDIDRLITVYEAMKPKSAAPLFEEMTSEFAAGFLRRMNPDSSAAILSTITPAKAHEISAIIAGQNAEVEKFEE